VRVASVAGLKLLLPRLPDQDLCRCQIDRLELMSEEGWSPAWLPDLPVCCQECQYELESTECGYCCGYSSSDLCELLCFKFNHGRILHFPGNFTGVIVLEICDGEYLLLTRVLTCCSVYREARWSRRRIWIRFSRRPDHIGYDSPVPCSETLRPTRKIFLAQTLALHSPFADCVFLCVINFFATSRGPEEAVRLLRNPEHSSAILCHLYILLHITL